MSSMRNPVGPEEPSVYWRRRAVVGVGLLVVLWLVWWLFSSVFGSDDPASDQQAPPAGATASPAAQTPAPSTASPPAKTPATASTPAGEQPKAASKKPPRCNDSAMAVVVTPANRDVEVGAGVKLTMTVTNEGSVTCRRDLGDPANEVQVVSGQVLVWSSNYCEDSQDGESAKAGVVTLKPGKSWSTVVTWPGKVTLAGCPAKQPTAKAGTYRAVARNGDKRSAESVFVLA